MNLLACSLIRYPRDSTSLRLSIYLPSPQSLSLAWLPRADGVFITEPPQQLVKKGLIADVPFVTGTFLFAAFTAYTTDTHRDR
jgi:hypothetical protein